MPKPAVLFASDTDDAGRRALARAAARGELLRLTAGVYTSEVADPTGASLRHLWQIIAHEMPGSVITDRSIADGGIGSDGVVFVCSPTRERPLTLPGVTVWPRRGPGAVDGDMRLPDDLWLASEARGLLDNLAGRRRAGLTRTLNREDVEQRLDQVCAHRGLAGLNRLRDHARAIAIELGRMPQLTVLDGLIGAVLSTRPAQHLTSPALRARAAGTPVDITRIAAFERLAGALADLAPAPLPTLPTADGRRALLPFYEAYFSNYIEGTEFTLDEAAAIVFDGDVPDTRPADAHDILGTYQLTSSVEEMSRVANTGEQLLDLLRQRHAVLMGGRPDSLPGRFKVRANRAGSTHFVAPDDVVGTLLHGFDAGKALIDPFARAVFLMFLVSEVHPFADGNGRIARIFMNSELVRGGQARIIIPTVYRENYLTALRTATHTAGDGALIAVLRFAQRWTARLDWTDRATAEADLTRTHALREAREAENVGVRLLLP